ncbi:hypothetical protein ACTHQ0_23990 [Priestia megaterium]|uniref:hypothetical protein n=1 Tax=Priestia megaterium TaxID=1404 RepID=UPI003F7F7C25
MAAKILKKRFVFFKLLQHWVDPIHKGIRRDLETLRIEYKNSIDVSEDADLPKMLEANIAEFDKIKVE